MHIANEIDNVFHETTQLSNGDIYIYIYIYIYIHLWKYKIVVTLARPIAAKSSLNLESNTRVEVFLSWSSTIFCSS